MAEASTFLSSGLIRDTVLDHTDATLLGLVAGAQDILEEENLARKFQVLRVLIAAGMREIVEESRDVLGVHPDELQ